MDIDIFLRNKQNQELGFGPLNNEDFKDSNPINKIGRYKHIAILGEFKFFGF